jgi:hypothetical protein
VDAACNEIVRVDKVIKPQTAMVEFMGTQYEAYRRMYPAIHSVLRY